MKTSNKILLALLLLIFVLPAWVTYMLQQQIKSNRFTLKSVDYTSAIYDTCHGSLAPFHSIRITAPSHYQSLTCHLIPSDSARYWFTQERSHRDSIAIFNRHDTLCIQYLNRSSAPGYDQFDVYLYVPFFNDLIVDGALVSIDSFPSLNHRLSVTLEHGGQIMDESEKPASPGKIKKQGDDTYHPPASDSAL